MKGLIMMLILALVVCNITTVHGLAMEGVMARVRGCKCSKHPSSAFSRKQLKSIQVIPRGIHCQRTEVILSMKNNWKICVDPNTPWVQELIKKLMMHRDFTQDRNV